MGKIGKFLWTAIVLAAVLAFVAKTVYYGFDFGTFVTLVSCAIVWLVLNHVGWSREEYLYREYSWQRDPEKGLRLSPLGWFVGWLLNIAIMIPATCVFMPVEGVTVANGATTLSSPALVAVPFYDHIDYAQNEYVVSRTDDARDAIVIPIDRHRALVVEAAASGFRLDDRNVPALESMLLARTAVSQHPSKEINAELRTIVTNAALAEIKNWSLERLDQHRGGLVLSDGIGVRIINDHVSQMGLRWKDGTLSINAHMQFNT